MFLFVLLIVRDNVSLFLLQVVQSRKLFGFESWIKLLISFIYDIQAFPWEVHFTRANSEGPMDKFYGQIIALNSLKCLVNTRSVKTVISCLTHSLHMLWFLQILDR